jgi:hypothetical protein
MKAVAFAAVTSLVLLFVWERVDIGAPRDTRLSG